MIIRKLRWKRATSALEYMALVVFVLAALVVMDKYILRSFWGQWRKAGDSFGHGKEYDPRSFGVDGDGGGTLQCMFVYANPNNPLDSSGQWVDVKCFDQCTINNPTDPPVICVNHCNAASIPALAYCNY